MSSRLSALEVICATKTDVSPVLPTKESSFDDTFALSTASGAPAAGRGDESAHHTEVAEDCGGADPAAHIAPSCGELNHICTWPWARLAELKASMLNGQAGTILDFDEDTRRCAFLIHG